MALNNEDDINMNSVDCTLEDTYEYLKYVKRRKEQEIKNMMTRIGNNEVKTINTDTSILEIRRKRSEFVQSLERLIAAEQPKNIPITNTLDSYADALKGLEDELCTMEELDRITDKEIAELEADIVYIEKKKHEFEQIKEASLNTADHETTNYEAEMLVTKRLFQEVKKDLSLVVDMLFPGNIGFQEFLCVLTRALSKGGDELYIDVTQNVVAFASFLFEADIIQFHPDNKNKIKLTTL